jgi:hypothetical protein
MTDTPAPTETPTPTETAPPTVSYWIEVLTPEGEPARIGREGTIFDVAVVVLLVLLLLSVWGMWITMRLRERG